MIHTIYSIKKQLRSGIISLGLPIYYDTKPASATGNCIVISHMAISKNNVESFNDIVIFIYIDKISDMENSKIISTYCIAISEILRTFKASEGYIHFNEEQEPETTNMKDQTVTTYVFRTISN